MTQNRIYVGNLSYSTNQAELHEYFTPCGEISEAKLIMDRDTGRSKGFAFVTFQNDAGVQEALKKDGTTLHDRQIKVSLAIDKRDGGGRKPQQRRNHGDYRGR